MYTSYSHAARRRPSSVESILYHDSPYRQFLDGYIKEVRKKLVPGGPIPAEFAERLLGFITDTRNLRLAWDTLARDGGQAPGPNGHRYPDFSESAIWELLRALKVAIREGEYRAGPTRESKIPKSSGNGMRTLHLPDIQDRVVQRAILQIIQPWLDPGFSDRSYGYRPGRDRRQALAEATRLTLDDQRTTWICEDVRDCFDHIPCQRLLQVLGKKLPDDVVQLIAAASTGDRKHGVYQGSPLSPFLVNVYLDHFLDRPWARDHGDAPLLRTADDILILPRSADQAEPLHQDLVARTRSAGLTLKGSPDSAICHLAKGETATWLGFTVRHAEGGLRVDLADRSWIKLRATLMNAHEHPLAALRAEQILDGFLYQAAPCSATNRLDDLVTRMHSLAADCGFAEFGSVAYYLPKWRNACDDWKRILDGQPLPVARQIDLPPDWYEDDAAVPF